MTFWAMDINPDQIVATGTVAEDAWPVRAFDWMNRQVLRAADSVVALDRYMAERLRAKFPIDGKLSVIPPWPHVEAAEAPLPHADNPFRAAHGRAGNSTTGSWTPIVTGTSSSSLSLSRGTVRNPVDRACACARAQMASS